MLNKRYIVFILVLGLILTNGCVDNQPKTIDYPTEPNNQANQPKTVLFGEKVVVGDFAYIFHDYQCCLEKIGEYSYGTFFGEKADGVFNILDVTVENVGRETKHFSSSNVKMVDERGRTFDPNTGAGYYLLDKDGFSFKQMQPGLPSRGKIVFDIPKEFTGAIYIVDSNFITKEEAFVSWKNVEEVREKKECTKLSECTPSQEFKDECESKGIRFYIWPTCVHGKCRFDCHWDDSDPYFKNTKERKEAMLNIRFAEIIETIEIKNYDTDLTKITIRLNEDYKKELDKISSGEELIINKSKFLNDKGISFPSSRGVDKFYIYSRQGKWWS